MTCWYIVLKVIPFTVKQLKTKMFLHYFRFCDSQDNYKKYPEKLTRDSIKISCKYQVTEITSKPTQSARWECYRIMQRRFEHSLSDWTVYGSKHKLQQKCQTENICKHDSRSCSKAQNNVPFEDLCGCWGVYIYIYIYIVALRHNAGHGLILEVSRSHTTTHHSR